MRSAERAIVVALALALVLPAAGNDDARLHAARKKNTHDRVTVRPDHRSCVQHCAMRMSCHVRSWLRGWGRLGEHRFDDSVWRCPEERRCHGGRTCRAFVDSWLRDPAMHVRYDATPVMMIERPRRVPRTCIMQRVLTPCGSTTAVAAVARPPRTAPAACCVGTVQACMMWAMHAVYHGYMRRSPRRLGTVFNRSISFTYTHRM